MAVSFPDWTADQIFEELGICARHIAEADECASGLAVVAADRPQDRGREVRDLYGAAQVMEERHDAGFLNTLRKLWKERRSSGGKKKACFLYYSVFNALIFREASVLRELGYDVDIVCFKRRTEETSYYSYHGMNVFCIHTRKEKEQSALRYFWNLGRFGMKSLAIVSSLQVLFKYKVVHVTSPPDIIVFASILPKLYGAGIILDIHDIGPELYMRKLGVSEEHPITVVLRFLERVSCSFADQVITVTEFWRQRLISRSVDPAKCTVLLNVPDDSVFRASSEGRSSKSGVVELCYHGTFDEHFGVEVMIDAFRKVVENGRSVLLRMYGDGRLRRALEEKIMALGLAEKVRMADPVPFFQLPELLKTADIGLVPTRDSTFSGETISMKSLEYMALGIPVVISRTKAHNHYYSDDMVKFFAPDDAGDMASSIISLIDDDEERKKLAREGLKFIQEHGWQVSKKIYQGIVEGIGRESTGAQ